MEKRLNLSRVMRLLCLLLATSSLTGNTSFNYHPAAYPPPGIICPDDTQQITYTKNLQRTSGNLDANDPLVSFSDYNCFSAFPNISDGDHAYDIVTFMPSVTTRYTFLLGTDFAGVFSLSYGDFSEGTPCFGLLGEATHSYPLPLPPTLNSSNQRLGFVLQAGETYTLFISNQAAATLGNWELMAYNDEGGTLSVFDSPSPQPIAFDLLWPDTKKIYFNAPQQWRVNADGSLDTSATLSTYFNNNQILFNRFLVKLSHTGMPAITGDCDLTLTLTDEITGLGGCGDLTITRTFEAQVEDSTCGDVVSSCQQVITLRRPVFADIQLPPREITFLCDEDFPTDGGLDGNPANYVTYRPALLSAFGYRDLPATLGNLSTSYFDEERIIVCDAIYKFRRIWHIGDWCAFLGDIAFEQFVRVGDDVGPILSNYQDTMIISTPPFNCEASVPIPTPDVVDGNGCSAIALTYFLIEDSQGNSIINGVFPITFVITLPIGDYNLIRCAEDACGNETCIETALLVQDEIDPNAECPENLYLLIGGGDTANGIEGVNRLEAIDLFEDSNDNCGEITAEVRRNYWRNGSCDPSPERWSPWDDYAWFYCCDLGTEITVELRVTDEAGNQSVCTTTAIIGDELAPYCYPPDDRTIHIISLPEEYPLDIMTAYETDFAATSLLMGELFGFASGTDNCAVDIIVEMTPVIQINECGEGTITRRFQSWQAMIDVNLSDGLQIEEVYPSTNECVQTITILPNHTFRIAFPADAYVDCDNPDAIGLEISAGDCDILAVNISEPVIYPSMNDACYEMAITYDVINWSVWDGVSDAYEIARITEEDGELWAAGYTVEPAERPIISLIASVGPDDENCDGVLDFSESNFPNLNDLRCTLTIDRSHPDEEGDSNIPDLTYDNIADTPAACIPTQNYGRYSYTQLLSVSDAGIPEIIVNDFGGPTELCPNLELGQFGDAFGICQAEVNISFTISNDCLELEGLDSLFSLGTVFAELDTFVVDVNSDEDIVDDEFNSDRDVSEGINYNNDGTYTFSADLPIITPQMGNNVYHALRIQFTDNCGNETTRIIAFEVIDCKGPAPICINGLTANLSPLMPLADIDGDGELDLYSSMISASMFEGSPIYDCTGQGPETHPVTGIPRVTRYAIYLASTVESAGESFVPNPTHTSILLTDQNDETTIVYIYAFDQEGNYGYCETYILVQLSSCSQENCEYIRGRITTANNEAISNVRIYLNDLGYRTNRYNGYYDLGYLILGQTTYTITPILDTDHSNGITAADITRLSDHLEGTNLLTSPYQLIAADVDRSGSIDYNDLQLLQQLFDGTITSFPNNTSWRFVDKAYVFPDPTDPWTEVFPESITLPDLAINLSDADFTGVKIGDIDGSAQGGFQSDDDPSLDGTYYLQTENFGEGFEVYQNTPNPFQAETLIGFYLPQDSEGILTVTDLTGKQLLVQRADYLVGYNTIRLSKEMLQGASGILTYTIATATHTASKKMVIVW